MSKFKNCRLHRAEVHRVPWQIKGSVQPISLRTLHLTTFSITQNRPFCRLKRGNFHSKKVASDLILSPFWRQIAASGHPVQERGGNSQNFIIKFARFFATLGLKILSL